MPLLRNVANEESRTAFTIVTRPCAWPALAFWAIITAGAVVGRVLWNRDEGSRHASRRVAPCRSSYLLSLLLFRFSQLSGTTHARKPSSARLLSIHERKRWALSMLPRGSLSNFHGGLLTIRDGRSSAGS